MFAPKLHKKCNKNAGDGVNEFCLDWLCPDLLMGEFARTGCRKGCDIMFRQVVESRNLAALRRRATRGLWGWQGRMSALACRQAAEDGSPQRERHS